MKKTLLWLMILAISVSMVVVFTLAGCKPAVEEEAAGEVAEEAAEEVEEEEAPAEEAAEEEVVAEDQIEIVLASQWGPNSVINYIIYGMDTAAEDLGVSAKLIAPDSGTVPDMVALLNAAIADEPDGVALIITEPPAFQDTIATMNDVGIPWGVFNTGFMGSGPGQLFYVGDYHYDAGWALAEKAHQEYDVTRFLNPNVIVGHSALDERCQGIADYFESQGIPGDTIDASLDVAEGANRVRAYLIDNPDTNFISAQGHVFNHSMVDVIKELGMDAKVAAFGVDELSAEYLVSGEIVAIESQQLFLQGYLSVVNLTLFKRHGMAPPPESKTGPFIYTAENVGNWTGMFEAVSTLYGQG